MRLFISINLPERSRILIENKVDLIRDSVTQDIKWVDSHQWHLTLKFLGDVTPGQIPEIKQHMQQAIGNISQFPAQFRSIGAFPHLNHPRVLFVDVDRGGDRLKIIHDNLEQELIKSDFERDDHQYHPHLTVARSRKQTDMDRLGRVYRQFTDRNFINVFMQARKLSLMESHLYPEGPEYEEIYSCNLK